MVRMTGISTPFGGINWEYTDNNSSYATMLLAILLESKRLLTMPWSRKYCRLPFELDVKYCINSAQELKVQISFILNTYKVSPPTLLAFKTIVHALNDFLDCAASVQNPLMIVGQSNKQQRFQSMVKQLKETVAHTMEPLLEDAFQNEPLSEQWRILNKNFE